MESLLAIGVGLVLRIVVDVATENDDRVGGVLVGLWEGVVLNHFVRRMPRSYDPYLGFGFRIFIDFLFTQSLSRLALVALWALVGMLLADIAPNFWRDSGLRHIYRQVRKDVRHVKRSVPHIRIKNDLPSVRLFAKSRSAPSEASGSIRSDRAVPSRSIASSPAPTPRPSRRPGPSPPGTLPDVSGWSETNTDVSNLRIRVVTSPGPSPALIPSREHAAYERIDAIRIATPRTQTTTIQNTAAFRASQTQREFVSIDATTLGPASVASTSLPFDDPSRHNPIVIPDDWVDIDRPTPAKSNEPVPPFKPDPDSTPEPRPCPSTPTPSRPVSVLVSPPAIDVLLDIPDVDHGHGASRPPDQVPLPESRAASVIGGVYDQPQPRGALRDSLHSRADKAASEIGIDAAKSLSPIPEAESVNTQSTTRSSWTSRARSKLKQSADPGAPEPPAKNNQGEPVGQGRPEMGSAAQGSDPQTSTLAQVDPPASILTHPGSGDAASLLLSAEPESVEQQQSQQQQPQPSKHEQAPASAGVDSSPMPPQGGTDVGSTGPRKSSLFDLPSPTRTPPPPFTEFAGVQDVAAGEGPEEEEPATQDEPPTELTEEQKALEEKRHSFLSTQVQELEGSRTDLQKKLDKKDDPASGPANAIKSDLEDADTTLKSIKARMAKKKFSESPLRSPVKEVSLVNKTATEVQFTITSAVLDMLLAQDDAGPMTVQVVINKQKTPKGKAKETKDAVMTFARRHRFTTRPDNATPGVISIIF